MLSESSILLLLWVLYFLLHSVLASFQFKKWVEKNFPAFTPFYRMSYNVFAGVSLLPILVLMLIWRGEAIIQWDGLWFYFINAVALLVLVMFYHSTRFYDMSEFLGTRQLSHQQNDTTDKAPMCVSPYHRFVRHPWYAFGLILIWTRSMDQLQLISSMAMTVYFVVGSLLEEKKLLVYYGDQYSSYKKLVPGLIPLPWKYLAQNQIP